MRVYLCHIEGSPYCLSVNAFDSDWRTLRTSLKCVLGESALHAWGTLGHTSSRSENCAWGVWDITDYEDESSNQRIFNSIFVFPQYTEFEENNIFCWNTADFNDLPRQFWAKHQRQPKSNRLRNVAASALDVNCLSFFSEGQYLAWETFCHFVSINMSCYLEFSDNCLCGILREKQTIVCGLLLSRFHQEGSNLELV